MTAPGFGKYNLFFKQRKIEVDDELTNPAIITEAAIQDINDDDAKVSWLGGSRSQL